MEKNENVEYFANMGIRLVGSVVVTAATGNKIDIAQFPSTNGNNNRKQARLIKSKYMAGIKLMLSLDIIHSKC